MHHWMAWSLLPLSSRAPISPYHRRVIPQETACPGRAFSSSIPIPTISCTQGLEDALKPLGFEGGPEIVCETLAEGPYGIGARPTSMAWRCRCAASSKATTSSAAFVIACYSDPGLHVCREATDRPVFGIAECGVLTALARAEILRRHCDRAALDSPPCPLPQADGLDGSPDQGAAAQHERGGDSVGRRNAREDDRGRTRAQGRRRIRRHRDGLCRHGASPPSRWSRRSGFP